tara:strand:+ start:8463 stop:9326 length:864 start_codon:yes stop_codon:yes gene_type:complete
MKILKYFIEFIIIKFLFIIFKIIGYKNSSNLGAIIGKIFGPMFRKKKIIMENLESSKIGKNEIERKKIIKNMWGNYGRILSEYPFIEHFDNGRLSNNLEIYGQEIVEKIKRENKNVVFVSGHFNNFELMAMHLENSGIKLAAIYRPLNNYFLNNTMENIRRRYICKKQIKKGKSGTREFIKLIKEGYSVAMMIDQRVTEGILSNFLNKDAFTTSIPAQIAKKYKMEIVPVYIERYNNHKFKLTIEKPIFFENQKSNYEITSELNICLEKMVKRNPDQWIWSHNRWKR